MEKEVIKLKEEYENGILKESYLTSIKATYI